MAFERLSEEDRAEYRVRHEQFRGALVVHRRELEASLIFGNAVISLPTPPTIGKPRGVKTLEPGPSRDVKVSTRIVVPSVFLLTDLCHRSRDSAFPLRRAPRSWWNSPRRLRRLSGRRRTSPWTWIVPTRRPPRSIAPRRRRRKRGRVRRRPREHR